MEWFVVEGNTQRMDGGSMFGNAPKALWSRWMESDDNNGVTLACRCLLVKSDDCVVLIDASTGPFMEPKLSSRYGVDSTRNDLISNLESLGVSESDVTHILLSHLHFDHCGGMLPTWPAMSDGNWQPLFSSAQYVVTREQYQRALSPHPRDRASYIPGFCEHLEATGRLVLVDDENTPVLGLDERFSFVISQGHTPGMLHPLVEVDGQKVFFPSDMMPGVPWVHLPITASFDRYPELLVDEKVAILDRAIAEDWIMVYVHDPEHPTSKIRNNVEKGRYEAKL